MIVSVSSIKIVVSSELSRFSVVDVSLDADDEHAHLIVEASLNTRRQPDVIVAQIARAIIVGVARGRFRTIRNVTIGVAKACADVGADVEARPGERQIGGSHGLCLDRRQVRSERWCGYKDCRRSGEKKFAHE